MRNRRSERSYRGTPAFRPAVELERLELRSLLAYPAILNVPNPNYVYGYASLGDNVCQRSVELSQQTTSNGVIACETDPDSLDEAFTNLVFDDNNSGDSTTASIEIDTFADDADGAFGNAVADGWTTNTPNSSPPGQNLIPIEIEPSAGDVIGQGVSVTLTARYQNQNIDITTGENQYAVYYNIGGTQYNVLSGSDTQMPPDDPVKAQTATFNATVGEIFYVSAFLGTSTAGGAPGASLSLDCTVSSGGTGGGGGGAPTAASYSYTAVSGQTLQVNAPGLLADDSAPNGLPIDATSYTDPSHGSLTVYTDGAFDYTPAANYTGDDSFTYTIEDSAGQTATGSVTIVVQPAQDAATHWAFTEVPSSPALAGVPFSVSVAAFDASGNLATSFSGPVTMILGASNGATLSGATTVFAQDGAATFTGLSVNEPGTYSLTISGGGLLEMEAVGFEFDAVTATQLVITTEPPPSVTAESSFGFTATAEDGSGNVATSFDGAVTVAPLPDNPDGATLGGPLIVNAVDGVAAFSGLSVSKGGGEYELQVTSSGLAPAFTSTIVVTAPIVAPITTTDAASAVTGTTATLNASVDPEGSATTVSFVYGTSSPLTTGTATTSAQSIGAGTDAVAVTWDLTGLTPGATYYFEVVATNAGGTAHGSIISFTTASPSAATATTGPALAVTNMTATLTGTVNPEGREATVVFEYGVNPTGALIVTTPMLVGDGTGPVEVSAPLVGLTPATTYYYEVFAYGEGWYATASMLSFTTGGNPPVTVSGVGWRTVRQGRRSVQELAIAFSGALDAAAAESVGGYWLYAAKTGRKSGSVYSRKVPFRVPSYIPSTNTVLLPLRGALPRQKVQLTINALAVLDAEQTPIEYGAGTGTGKPAISWRVIDG